MVLNVSSAPKIFGEKSGKIVLCELGSINKYN